MQDKLRKHIDEIFEDTTPTRKAAELREEMIQNLEDKYKDLIAEGKSPEAAYNIAVAGIGDVSGLLEELEKEYEFSPWAKYENEAARKKSAMLTAIAVMMYILSPLTLIILTLVGVGVDAVIGVPVLLLFVAVATGLLIYNNMTKPKYEKESDTMIEEFKEWKEENKGKKSMKDAISSALWSIIAALYFIISFTTGAWHITWVIFVIGGAVQTLLNAFISSRK
jgi:uncharacterized membrane protein